MDDIYIGPVVIYVERDKEGYINLSTDGFLGDELDPIIEALRALQTDDDREYGAAMNSRNRNRNRIGG
jgi:hypothetical protein